MSELKTIRNIEWQLIHTGLGRHPWMAAENREGENRKFSCYSEATRGDLVAALERGEFR